MFGLTRIYIRAYISFAGSEMENRLAYRSQARSELCGVQDTHIRSMRVRIVAHSWARDYPPRYDTGHGTHTAPCHYREGGTLPLRCPMGGQLHQPKHLSTIRPGSHHARASPVPPMALERDLRARPIRPSAAQLPPCGSMFNMSPRSRRKVSLSTAFVNRSAIIYSLWTR